MAGGVLKLLGTVVLVLGVVVLVGGIAAVGYGFFDEQGNDPSLLSGRDADRSDQNQAIVLGGGMAAGAGTLLLLIGITLLVTGSWLTGRELRREIRERTQTPPMVSR